jgi:hypothetical protein
LREGKDITKVQSLFDDVARILAKPAPRRQALKLAAGVFAGGVLAALGVKPASAEDSPAACKAGYTACGKSGLCCANTKKCCITESRGAFCVANKNDICCANTACGPKTVCCHGVCCAPGQTCVNNRCSGSKAA